MIKKLCLFFAALIMIQVSLSTPLLAASQDYILSGDKRVPIPESYLISKTIYSIGAPEGMTSYFDKPQDLFINEQGYLFVADTGNNRIVKLTTDGTVVGIYSGDPDSPLRSPAGIYADEVGEMYIADTQNNRIVHLAADGRFIEEFVTPSSELLRDTFALAPSKLLVSPTGYIYTVKGQNIMAMDAYNRFRGFLGQTEIGFRFVDAFIRMFASQEQRNNIAKRNAPYYLNITMDTKGFIYATSLDPGGEIKKLNSLGFDLFKHRKNKQPLGERRNIETGEPLTPRFIDIAVSSQGIITALEELSGKLYQYDQDGNLLTVFGGKGTKKGKFSAPTSIVNDSDGNLYVLDGAQGGIYVFAPTRFIQRVHQAVDLYSQGEYLKAYEAWEEVASINENYQLVYSGLADTLYKQEQWNESMDNYQMANDRSGYSNAFSEFRYVMLRHYFFLVVLLIILGVFLLFQCVKWLKRLSVEAAQEAERGKGRMNVITGINLSLGVIFQPRQTFELIITARGRLNYGAGILILLAVFLVRMIYLAVIHYPLESMNIIESNLLLESVKLLLPPLTWIVASFFITSISDGESKIGEIFTASSYCMVPYLLMMVPLALLSNILSLQESVLFDLLYSGMWVWILILFFISIKMLNDYTMLKSTIAYAASGASILLLWSIGLLWYVLSGRLYMFISGVVREVQMSWM
ncbi:YIP1 family protein [Paenibacillus eucommiae]|uniref:DNA-binding beta-propeller fold protein YncE n=1 Tax=Paenibacillus eucommiae TaxID=1355755 RepID=A0ABS4INI5_9BACL|nr:YIP1 family protein [Paenibacillus eucommiae]MBP1989075.1 DNA-binding beta-propeller fold protein YncE [Paenibacillus eucommiae]